jgi:hypothetical protein
MMQTEMTVVELGASGCELLMQQWSNTKAATADIVRMSQIDDIFTTED